MSDDRQVSKLEQLDGALLAYAHHLDEALEEGDDHKADLLLRITEALVSREKEVVDQLVEGLNGLEDQIAYAQKKANLYLAAKERIEMAREKIRLHVQNHIDHNLPEDNRRLDGKLFWIRTQANSSMAVRIDDPAAVPPEYQTCTVKLVLPAGDTVAELAGQLDTLQLFMSEFCPGARIDGTVEDLLKSKAVDGAGVRLALDAGIPVPGARLERGRHLRHSKPKRAISTAPPQSS
jgi:hypothetical protein